MIHFLLKLRSRYVKCLLYSFSWHNLFLNSQLNVFKCEFDADLDPRPEYHRCFLKWSEKSENVLPSAYSTGNQHSSRLLSMNEANCLVILPGRTNMKNCVNKGEILDALIIDQI